MSIELVGGPFDGATHDGGWVALWRPVPGEPGRFYEYVLESPGRATYRGVIGGSSSTPPVRTFSHM